MRHSTIPPKKTTAIEQSKTLELEQRIARVEGRLHELERAFAQRLSALQAQLDHFIARIGRH